MYCDIKEVNSRDRSRAARKVILDELKDALELLQRRERDLITTARTAIELLTAANGDGRATGGVVAFRVVGIVDVHPGGLSESGGRH